MTKTQSAPVDAAARFSPEAQHALRAAIEAVEGREVFAMGTLDAANKVATVDIIARGSDDAVAAPFRNREVAQVLIHNHPSGTLFPSEADVAVAAEAGAEGFGSYIIDNAVSKVFVIVEPARPKKLRPLDADAIAAVLDEGGKLSHRMESFEPRPSQVAMAHDVAEFFLLVVF